MLTETGRYKVEEGRLGMLVHVHDKYRQQQASNVSYKEYLASANNLR